MKELGDNNFLVEKKYLESAEIIVAENQTCFIILQFEKKEHCKCVQEALAKLIRSNVKRLRNNMKRKEGQISIHDYGQGYVVASEQSVRDTRKMLKVHMNHILNNTIKRDSRSLVLYIATPVLFFGHQPKISIYGHIIKEQLLKLTIKNKKYSFANNATVCKYQVLWLFRHNGFPTARWISTEYALQLISDYDTDAGSVPSA